MPATCEFPCPGRPAMSGATPNEDFAGARRVEAWAGEVRLNLVRLAALTAFYACHLVNVYLKREDTELAGP